MTDTAALPASRLKDITKRFWALEATEDDMKCLLGHIQALEELLDWVDQGDAASNYSTFEAPSWRHRLGIVE
jgi:hypothetical protein